jgi:hypothetical protein
MSASGVSEREGIARRQRPRPPGGTKVCGSPAVTGAEELRLWRRRGRGGRRRTGSLGAFRRSTQVKGGRSVAGSKLGNWMPPRGSRQPPPRGAGGRCFELRWWDARARTERQRWPSRRPVLSRATSPTESGLGFGRQSVLPCPSQVRSSAGL